MWTLCAQTARALRVRVRVHAMWTLCGQTARALRVRVHAMWTLTQHQGQYDLNNCEKIDVYVGITNVDMSRADHTCLKSYSCTAPPQYYN